MGSIVVRRPLRAGKSDEVRVYCKGAPDFVLKNTTMAVNANGVTVNIDEEVQVPTALLNDGGASTDTHRGVFERTIKNFANQAYRTILTTFRDMSMQEFE
jgi:magnesium-transporting ATPase (P-type)